MSNKIREHHDLIKTKRLAIEQTRCEMIERVNCRYEEVLGMYNLDREDMSYGEAMALRDILFELEEM